MMRLLFVEATEDGWRAEAWDGEKMTFARQGTSVERIEFAVEKYVVVTWQTERVLKILGYNPFGSRAIVDLYQMAWVLVAADQINSRGLDALAKWSAAAEPVANDLEQRVSTIRECYLRLTHRVKLGLEVEGVGREVATKLFNSGMELVSKFVK